MNSKIQAMLTSYARTFLAVVTYAILNGETNVKAIVVAGAVAVVGPAIRAINPKDPAFGLIANTVEAELTKVAKRTKK